MKKIPVVETIAFAYNFTFGHLGAIIGLIWVPAVLLAIGQYFAMSYYYGHILAALAQGTLFKLGPAMAMALGWAVISLALSAMMSVAVVRQALGLRQGPAWIHFAFGLTELRVMLASLGVVAVLVVLSLAAAVGITVLTQTVLAGSSQKNAVVFAAIVLIAVALIYTAIRLSFLIVPVAVVEERIGLGRDWELASGNVWRILIIGICVLGPAILVSGAAQTAVLGPDYFSHALQSAGQAHSQSEQMKMMAANLPMLTGLSLFLSPFIIGLTQAPAAAAYRALTGVGADVTA